MRLFIAVNFNENIKNNLYKTVGKLKAQTVKGNFTHKENMHITLVFLGEINFAKTGNIKSAMDKVKCSPFKINIKDIGRFRRSGGDIYWMGIDNFSNLKALYSQLCENLINEGFNIEKREFKPHLTLGRQIIVNDNFNRKEFSNSIPNISVLVDKISLMKSERIKGKLTYTEIYAKML